MNELYLIVEILIIFSMVVLSYRFFGKYGLFAWIAIATILANIQVTKQVTVFGLDVTMGNVLFASTFLATDILNEKLGFKHSRKGVYIGLFSVICFLVVSQITLLFKPNSFDLVSGSMNTLFSLSPRVCISSVIMFFLANLLDVYLFEYLKKHFPKHLWLRNNVATLVSNCLENFVFTLGAFMFIYPIQDCMIIALNTCIIEIFIGLCDTPFLYLVKKLRKGDV